MKNLAILGCGGHARSVGDVALAAGARRLLFIDANAGKGETFFGFPVVAKLPSGLDGDWLAFPGSGNGTTRRSQSESTTLDLARVIAPDASVGFGSSIGTGTFIGRHAHVGPLAAIGDGVILNTGSIVDHDSVVGDYSHISVNATVAGRCKIGRHVMIGAGAVVIDGVAICDNVIIGAGAAVVSDINDPSVYIGIPARKVG